MNACGRWITSLAEAGEVGGRQGIFGVPCISLVWNRANMDSTVSPEWELGDLRQCYHTRPSVIMRPGLQLHRHATETVCAYGHFLKRFAPAGLMVSGDLSYFAKCNVKSEIATRSLRRSPRKRETSPIHLGGGRGIKAPPRPAADFAE